MATTDPARVLHRGATLTLGEFHLEPGHRRWSETECIGEGHHVVFPGTPVRIAQHGREPIVCDPTLAVLYDPQQEYRRALVSARGDHCTYVIVAPGALAEIMGAPEDEVRFDASHRPVGARAYLAQRWVAARAARGGSDSVEIEEVLLGVVGTILQREGGATPARLSARGRALAEETRAVLGARYAEPLRLSDVAAAVSVSPFHLARTFRAHTGSSIHAYRNQVRLRASLELLAGGETSIVEVAIACGYASHAHYAGAFRATFGCPPSAVRGAREAARMRTILEAMLAARR